MNRYMAMTHIALSADHLIAVVLRGEGLERRLNDTTTEAEDEVEGGFLIRHQQASTPKFRHQSMRKQGTTKTRGITDLLDVIIRKSAAILELLSRKDKSLLVGGDSLLILNLGLHIVDCVRGLNLEGNGLTREGLDKTKFGFDQYLVIAIDSVNRRLTSAL